MLLTVGVSPPVIYYSISSTAVHLLLCDQRVNPWFLGHSAGDAFGPQHTTGSKHLTANSSACYRALRNLPPILQKWEWVGRSLRRLHGGTKSCPGLYCSPIKQSPCVDDLQTQGRANAGLGVVLDGRERIFARPILERHGRG